MHSHGWRRVYWSMTTHGTATVHCSRHSAAWRTIMKQQHASCAAALSWGTRRDVRSWQWTPICATWPGAPPTTPCWWPCSAGSPWSSPMSSTTSGRTRRMHGATWSTSSLYRANLGSQTNQRTSAPWCDVIVYANKALTKRVEKKIGAKFLIPESNSILFKLRHQP